MFFFFQTMDPGQDLLLAALSESGICPNDLFDIDSQDTAQSPASQQVNKSINEGLVVFGMRLFDALCGGWGAGCKMCLLVCFEHCYVDK